MLQIIKADQRHFADLGWVRSHWLFSFSDYYDPENEDFGPLHVFNDDTLEPGTGFPLHPHTEMEIVTIVFSGEITHEDTLGTEIVLKAGEVQRMTAGTGVAHSEYNLGTEPVHLYQIWITPSEHGLEPGYEHRVIDREASRNRLLPLVSGDSIPETIHIHRDATIFIGELDPGTIVEHDAPPGRRMFVYVTDGELSLDGAVIATNDQVRAMDEPVLRMTALKPSRILLIDLESD
jgi:redox-sensitive bicupin YhaK (pirin superfamily)